MPVDRYLKVYYSPEEPIDQVLVAMPARATASIDVECYGFTLPLLVSNLIAAHQRGVWVRVMNDRSQSAGAADHHALQLLVDAGIEVRVVESRSGAIDHLKNIVIDGRKGAADDGSFVGQGSFNFSSSAQGENNFMLVTNDPGVTWKAMQIFEDHWQHNPQRPEWQVAPTAPTQPAVTVAVAGVPPEAVAVTVAPQATGPLPAAASIEQGAPN